jgi:hypothetical protein
MDVVEKPVVGGDPSREPGADLDLDIGEILLVYPADMRRPKLARAVLDEIDDEGGEGDDLLELRGEDGKGVGLLERVPDVLEDLEQREDLLLGLGDRAR